MHLSTCVVLTTPYLLSHLQNLVSYLTRLGRIVGSELPYGGFIHYSQNVMILDLGQHLDQDYYLYL